MKIDNGEFLHDQSLWMQGGIDAAVARIKKEAVPPNCRRLGLNTPCAQTGVCGGKNCKDPSCRLTVVVDAVPRLRKMTVIFTEEKLGFTGKKEGIAAHAVCLIEE